MVKSGDIGSSSSRPSARVIDLGPVLKPLPAKARNKRVGVVPAQAPAGGKLGVHNADGFQFPPNGGVTDTNVVFHGGTVAGGATVQLIFWGTSWNAGDATLRDQLTMAALNLIDGPFYSALGQYGLGGPTFGGLFTVTGPAPPASFDDGTIGDLVWNMIDQNIFADPDEPGGANFYCVMMPPGTTYSPGGALGAHSWPSDWDVFDVDNAWVAWIGHADLNTMTRAFGHELAETVTDPQGDGWFIDSSGNEIGDICNGQRSFHKGVFVEGYWAKNTGACVIPQCPDLITGVSRSADHLDIFAIGTDGGTYTAAWEPDFTDGWHGWWRIQGGVAAPGTSIFGVSRSLDHLDVFAVGTDFGVYTAAWEPDFTDGWHGWWRLGSLTVAPGTSVHAVSRAQDRIDVFAVASDFRVMTSGWSPTSGGWTPWTQVQGGVVAPGTNVYGVSRGPGKIDIFAVGTDHHVYTAAWDDASPGWHGWSGVQNGLVATGTSVYPVSRSLDHLDIFAVGTDHGVYTAAWEPDFTDGWHGWWRIQNGTVAPGTSVFAVSRSQDHLDVFAVGTDHGTYTAAWEPDFTDGWHGWWRIQNGTVAPGTSIFAVSRSLNHLDIFAVGTDHGTYTAAWEPDFTDGWHGWWRVQNGTAAWGM